MPHFLNDKPRVVVWFVQNTFVQINLTTAYWAYWALARDIPSFLYRHCSPQIVPLTNIQFFRTCRFNFACFKRFAGNFIYEFVPAFTYLTSCCVVHAANHVVILLPSRQDKSPLLLLCHQLTAHVDAAKHHYSDSKRLFPLSFICQGYGS